MSPYDTTSEPPISKVPLTSSGKSSPASRYASTSSIAIGWVRVETHRGQTMSGKRSTSARIISKDRLPAPMTIDARQLDHRDAARAQHVAGLGAALQVR